MLFVEARVPLQALKARVFFGTMARRMTPMQAAHCATIPPAKDEGASRRANNKSTLASIAEEKVALRHVEVVRCYRRPNKIVLDGSCLCVGTCCCVVPTHMNSN
eukprot:TRINITY_DN16669_c0_g1_i1.p1 TRINITY_DN16669_c0_g1~~TRINITY_DN16669_c0_g1_i1.p1  ORF type:complete len:104 (-),score=10.59 TRINITY_DN16669_c0_g1_i1:64-375(-)